MSALSHLFVTLATARRLALRAPLALIPVFVSAGLAQPVCQLTRLLQIFWTLLYALGTLVQRGFARRSRGLSPVVQYVRILSASLMAVVVPCLLGLSSAHAQTSSANASKIAAGFYNNCALTTVGGVKCWGSNYSGGLGDNSTTNRSTPVSTQGLASGVAAIAAGALHTCALTTAGGVKCWGFNRWGQLGDNTTTDRWTPINVQGLTSGVAAIAAGGWHTCALTMAGGVKCWGWNDYGQLGDNSNMDRWTPVNVQGLASGVAAIAAGYYYTCALTTAGGVKCWGSNIAGYLDNSYLDRWTPVNVQGLASGVSAIAVGNNHFCALTTTGGVKCWGNNYDGQVGDNSTTNRLTPVNVQGLASGVSAIAMGQEHSCALTTAGGVKCWGSNYYGELGDNSTTNRSTPVNVQGLASGVSAIVAGSYNTCALTTGGGVKCWGENDDGELGDNSTTDRWTPVNVWGFGAEQTQPAREIDLMEDPDIWPTPASKAVVITHGWNAQASDVGDWVNEMARDVCYKLGAIIVNFSVKADTKAKMTKMCQFNDWDVWIVDWRAKAATGYVHPEDAHTNASPIGGNLATSLKTKPYIHVHLIAHSAGANLIQAATNSLKQTMPSAPSIHETFLDAYDPAKKIDKYGSNADWADNYVDTRLVFAEIKDGTKLFLENAYNINVTPSGGCPYVVDIASVCRHSRPYRFYGLSVDPSFVGWDDYKTHDPVDSFSNMGYLLTLENHKDLASLKTQYPPNHTCEVVGSACVAASPAPVLLNVNSSVPVNWVIDSTAGTVIPTSGVNVPFTIKMGNTPASGVSAASGAQPASATPTESPSWIVVLPTPAQPVNTMRFNWRFAAAGEGLLRVFVDGNLVRELDQRHVPLASTTTEEVYIGGADGMLPAGTHRIAFRLDGFGASASGVELTNIELGLGLNEDFLTTGTVPTGWVQPAGSNAAWVVVSDAANAGTLSLKSGAIADSQKSELSYSANFLAGNVSFARKVSSESCCDYLQFYVDGVLQGAWSGELDWAVVSFPMSAGPHTLLWRYLKDSSVSTGSDAAWIDSVTLPGVVPPVAQSISFGPAPIVEIGHTGSVSATATSGLAVSLRSTSSGVCTIAGTVVSGVTVGLCTIAATQVGNGVYAPAAEVLQVFSVTGVLTTPGAPSIVSISAGPGRVTLTLQPPGNTGGGPITSYSATCSASGHPSVTAGSTTATVVVPGLVPGVSYACTATASNGRYTSLATPASAPVIPKPKADLTPILMLLLD